MRILFMSSSDTPKICTVKQQRGGGGYQDKAQTPCASPPTNQVWTLELFRQHRSAGQPACLARDSAQVELAGSLRAVVHQRHTL